MNSISDTYRSIAAPSKGIYKELGSKFLALAYPVGWILCSTLLIIRYSRSVLVRGEKAKAPAEAG